MLAKAFKSPAESEKNSVEGELPPISIISAAIKGMSDEDTSAYLRRLMESSSEQDKVMLDASKIDQAVRAFHAILDDDEIKNKREYLNLNFASLYEHELNDDPKFIMQLSRNLSTHYNRYITPLVVRESPQNMLYQNIIARSRKIVGSGFLKQYIRIGDTRYSDVALSIDIVLIMHSMESMRERFNLLLGAKEPMGSNYIACIRDIEHSLKIIEALECEMFLLLELAFASFKNSEVLELCASNELETWCNDKEHIAKVSLNLYQLHLSFIHCSVFKAQLRAILGDDEDAKDTAENARTKADWAIKNIKTLLGRTTYSEERAVIELLRNYNECEKIISECEDIVLEHKVQFACYQAVIKDKGPSPLVSFDDVLNLLSSNKPVDDLETYSEKFSASLKLYDVLINDCKDKDTLMTAYRHWLLWQQWFGGLKDKKNLSGKVCANYLMQIGIQLKDSLNEAISLEKEEQIKLEAEQAVQDAEKARASLIQEEKEQKAAKKIAAQKKEKRALEQAKKAKERKKLALQERKKAEVLEKEKEQRLLQEQEKLREQQRANQERTKRERERQKREKTAQKKREKRARLREQKKIKQELKQEKLKAEQQEIEQEILEEKRREAEIAQEKLKAEQQEIEPQVEDEVSRLIESLDSLLIAVPIKEDEKFAVVDEQNDELLPRAAIKIDKAKEWVNLRGDQSPFENIFIPADIKQLMSEIESVGYHVVLYGGFPRDSLLNLRVNDYDLVTDCPIETLMTLRDFTVTLMPNCYTFGPFMDMSVISDFDLVKFSKSRYLAANALFATKEGRVFAATDEIYPLFQSPHLLRTGDIRAAFEEDPSRILRTVYYTNHTRKPLTKETVSAMRHCAELIPQKVPFGVVRARLGDLFLRGNANQSFALLLELKIAHHIVAGLGSVIFNRMNTDDYLYQFMADQFSQIDFFISHGNNSKTRYNALALLLLPYHQELLSYKKETSQNCAVLAASLFCDEYSIFDAEKSKLARRLALMIDDYGIQFLYFQSKKYEMSVLAQDKLAVYQPAPPVFMVSSQPAKLAIQPSNRSPYDYDFPEVQKKGKRV